MPTYYSSRKEPWYRQTIIIALLTIFFFPLGLILILTHPRYQKRTKIFWASIVAGFVFLTLTGCSQESESIPTASTTAVTTTVTTETTTMTTITSTTETTTSTTTTTTTVTTTETTTTTAETTTIPPTEPPTEPPTAPPAPVQEEVPAEQPVESQVIHFVLNLDSHCLHCNPNCSAAQKILPENYSTIDIPEDQLANYAGQYWACGKCSKAYSSQLPKF